MWISIIFFYCFGETSTTPRKTALNVLKNDQHSPFVVMLLLMLLMLLLWLSLSLLRRDILYQCDQHEDNSETSTSYARWSCTALSTRFVFFFMRVLLLRFLTFIFTTTWPHLKCDKTLQNKLWKYGYVSRTIHNPYS